MVYEGLNAVQIGAKLKELRIVHGETMDDLSKAIGTSNSAIAMYESGKRVPRDEIKIRIAEHFSTPVETIFFPEKQHEVCGKNGEQ